MLQAIEQNDRGDKFEMDGAPLDVSLVCELSPSPPSYKLTALPDADRACGLGCLYQALIGVYI